MTIIILVMLMAIADIMADVLRVVFVMIVFTECNAGDRLNY